MVTAERNAIAGQIRAEMARHSVTRGELARRISVTRTVLADRLSGERPFTTDQLLAIAQALGVSFIDLFPADSTSDEAAAG